MYPRVCCGDQVSSTQGIENEDSCTSDGLHGSNEFHIGKFRARVMRKGRVTPANIPKLYGSTKKATEFALVTVNICEHTKVGTYGYAILADKMCLCGIGI